MFYKNTFCYNRSGLNIEKYILSGSLRTKKMFRIGCATYLPVKHMYLHTSKHDILYVVQVRDL